MVDVRPSERQGIREQSEAADSVVWGKDWAAEIAPAVWQGATMAVSGDRSPGGAEQRDMEAVSGQKPWENGAPG